jgi:Autophagy receptor ATG43
MASSSIPIEIAGTLQSASINRHPDPRHDLNPSTAASKKEPVTVAPTSDLSDVEEDEIPVSVLRPIPRRQTLPPLPDLRFEQSYLRSIEKAQTWGAISWITFRDQVRADIVLASYLTDH